MTFMDHVLIGFTEFILHRKRSLQFSRYFKKYIRAIQFECERLTILL